MAGSDKVIPLYIKAEFFCFDDKTNEEGKTLLVLMLNSHNVIAQFYLSGFLVQAFDDEKLTKDDQQKIKPMFKEKDNLFSIPHEADLDTHQYCLDGPKLIFTDVLSQAEEAVQNYNKSHLNDRITKIQLIDVTDVNLLRPAREKFPRELFQHMVDKVEKIGKNDSLECVVDIQSFSAIHDKNKIDLLENSQNDFKSHNKNYVKKIDFIGNNAVLTFRKYLKEKLQNVEGELIHLKSYKPTDDFRKELDKKKEEVWNEWKLTTSKGRSPKKPEKPTISMSQPQLMKPQGDEQAPVNYSQIFSLGTNWKSLEHPSYKKTPAITTLSTLDEELEKQTVFKDLKGQFKKLRATFLEEGAEKKTTPSVLKAQFKTLQGQSSSKKESISKEITGGTGQQPRSKF